MSLVVEDGTGRLDADSYVSADAVSAYAKSRGKLWVPESNDLGDAACRNASQWIDSMYRGRFPGFRRRSRDQAMEWPRRSAYVAAGGVLGWGYDVIPEDAIPREVIQATCEAAIRELAEPGILAPDLEQGGSITSVQAGSASVTFGGGGLTGSKTFQQIDQILSTLLPSYNPNCGSTGRG